MVLSLQDKTGRTLSGNEVMQKGRNRAETIWREIIVAFLHSVGNIPFHHLRRFFYRLAGVQIGQGSTLHMGTRFYNPKNIVIGEDTIVGENVVLDGRAALVIGSHVDIATEVMIYNGQHDINDPTFVAHTAPVKVEDYVFIGPRAIILCGVTIGKGAVVGAGAVVTKDVAPGDIVGGVPARPIGQRSLKEYSYKLGRAAWFR